MLLNIEYDANALAAPQSFRDTINAAADVIEATFSDPITVNLSVGYGELTFNGVADPLTAGAAEAQTTSGHLYTYPTVRNLLAGAVSSDVVSGVSTLPITSTLQGQSNVIVWSAEEKALGLISPTDGALDGAAGFATDISLDLLKGVALHELTHAMGRLSGAGSTPDVFDFYRFTSESTRLFGHADTAPSSYFSLDNGVTDLADYGQSSDPSDFLNTGGRTTNDAFNEFYSPATAQAFSQVDLLQMQALGFHLVAAAQSPQPPQPPPPPVVTHHSNVDVLFRDSATGDWGYMSVQTTGEAWHPIGPTSPDYDAVGKKADFDGDGSPDVAYRERTTGDWGFMSIDTGGGETWHPMGPSSTAYAAVASGDFNGDGKSDLAFRNTADGSWGYMSAGQNGEIWHPIGPASTDYAVVGAGDFNGDGVADLAFRNVTTGDWGYMAMDRSGAGETWHQIGPSSTAYAVIGAGDFNGDGVTDLAFRETTTGDWGYMALNSSGAGEVWHQIGPSSTGYSAVATGDFNGDSVTDVAFRENATGDWGYMALNTSGAGEIWHPMGPASDAYWVI